jgi:rubrerythrin
MYEINLDMVDQDGAIREAHEAVAGHTRLSFLKKAGIGAAGVASGGAVLAALAPSALAAGAPPASFGKGDIGILNYALTLEYLERAFYDEATSNGIVKDAQLKGILETTTRDERAHVAALLKALGSKATALPKFNFGDAVTNEAKFAATAFVLENTGVHAYLGQVPNITSATVLGVAGSIVTIEARHAGAIGSYLKHSPAEIAPSGAFDTGLTAAKVLAAVKSTGFIV